MNVVNTANSDTGNNKTNNKYEIAEFGDVEVAWLTVDFSDSGALDYVRFSMTTRRSRQYRYRALCGCLQQRRPAQLGFAPEKLSRTASQRY